MRSKIIIPIFVLLVLSLACNFSGGNDTPTEVPPTAVPVEPTNPPQPTTPPPTEVPPTAEVVQPTEVPPTEESVAMNEPFRTEEFDGDLSYWYWFTTYGDENKLDIYEDRGKVVFELTGEDIYAYLMYDEYYYDDVMISTLVENRGKNSNSVSLVCRYDESLGWYEFNIGSDGLYNILRYDVSQEEYIFIANGGSNQIKTGQEYNEYTVSCAGDYLTLWINGKETNSVRDRTLREGLIGISASSYSVTPIIVEFEYVDISLP